MLSYFNNLNRCCQKRKKSQERTNLSYETQSLAIFQVSLSRYCFPTFQKLTNPFTHAYQVLVISSITVRKEYMDFFSSVYKYANKIVFHASNNMSIEGMKKNPFGSRSTLDRSVVASRSVSRAGGGGGGGGRVKF